MNHLRENPTMVNDYFHQYVSLAMLKLWLTFIAVGIGDPAQVLDLVDDLIMADLS